MLDNYAIGKTLDSDMCFFGYIRVQAVNENFEKIYLNRRSLDEKHFT